MRFIVFGISVLFVISAQAGDRIELNVGENQVTKKDVLSVSATWIKDKEKKYDIHLNMMNESEKGEIVLLNDMHCFRGNASGTLKHTFFNTGERTIDFKSRESKSFNMVCDLRAKATGDFRIVVKKVYANPSGDGASRGEVLASDLEWKAAEPPTAKK